MSSTREQITSLLLSVKRDGIQNLVEYLEKSTFFIDPASCQDHNSSEGGLAEHSLKMYHCLKNLADSNKEIANFEESLIIIGLLHDICLAGTFQKVTKNLPLKGSDGKNKKGENGKIIFIEKESYDSFPEANLPYPHGQLSAMIIKKYIKLTKLEDLAIQWHKGAYDISQNQWPLLKRAQKTHRIILLSHFADLESSLY